MSLYLASHSTMQFTQTIAPDVGNTWPKYNSDPCCATYQQCIKDCPSPRFCALCGTGMLGYVAIDLAALQWFGIDLFVIALAGTIYVGVSSHSLPGPWSSICFLF